MYNKDGVELIGLDEAAAKLGPYFIFFLMIYLLFLWFIFFSDLIYVFLFWIFSGVERRRIYDIVNVLESVGVIFSLFFSNFCIFFLVYDLRENEFFI